MGAAAEDYVVGEEEGYVSDSEAFASIVHVLDAVRMAPNLVSPSDRDQYDYLLSIVDPSKKFGIDEEALLVTALRALSGAVSKIDSLHHASLLSNIFAMRIWYFGADARNALLELIVSLAGVPDKFLDGCLHLLVRNFIPTDKMLENVYQSRIISKKREIHSEIQMALRYVFHVVPLAPLKLREVIEKSMPRCIDPKSKITVFVECLLGLESEGEIGEVIATTALAKVVDLLTDLDVNICWEDILQEDQNKGMFDMELEDLDDDFSKLLGDDRKIGAISNGQYGGNAFAKKLDSLMLIVCGHLKLRAERGFLLKDFETLMIVFRRCILKLYKSKFAQFVMFYACSLDPDVCGLNFAVHLTDIFISRTHDPITRMSAISYLGSYLSRAKFISPSIVASFLKRLVDWCFDYCRFQNGIERAFNPKAHQVFYSCCQAVMYILCFRMRSMIDIQELKSLLFHLPLGFIFCHPLDPLKVCLPSIVQEFLRQAKAAKLFNASVPSIYENALESELSKAFGGIERLDMFFPFDPYLLKESDRFIRPNFEFWSMVKTTYSNCNSEGDDEDAESEFDDLDAPEIITDNLVHPIGSFDDDNNININNSDDDDEDDADDDDDLGYSMNKMSITPEQTFQFHPAMSQMPARIRPSASPTW